MARSSRRYEMDMCSGPIFRQVVAFAIPLMLSGILQLLYNAADVVVVGRFAGSTALAAVGSTGSITNLIVNIFMGLSVGASVTVANHYGAGRYKDVSESVHTSILISIIGGFIVGIIGVTLAPTFLKLMDSPADVIDQASLYMRIYFAGMPVNMVYNFGSAVLRAVGDTKRPLYFLTIAGVINVVLNLIFVIVFHMGVAGVALATIISQAVSAALVVICLIRTEGPIHLDLKKLGLKKDKVISIVKIGLPAGLQGSLFSISNVLIQSSVNSFGSTVMAANAAAGNLEGFVYVGMNALHQAALSFSGQNMGAKRYDRLNKILSYCVLSVSVIGLIMGVGVWLLGEPLVGIYATDPEVIAIGKRRLMYVAAPYFLCGIMDVFAGQLRGMGSSLMPTIVTIIGVCVLRVGWVYTVFAATRSYELLLLSYPISWALTAAAHYVSYLFLKRKYPNSQAQIPAEET